MSRCISTLLGVAVVLMAVAPSQAAGVVSLSRGEPLKDARQAVLYRGPRMLNGRRAIPGGSVLGAALRNLETRNALQSTPSVPGAPAPADPAAAPAAAVLPAPATAALPTRSPHAWGLVSPRRPPRAGAHGLEGPGGTVD